MCSPFWISTVTGSGCLSSVGLYPRPYDSSNSMCLFSSLFNDVWINKDVDGQLTSERCPGWRKLAFLCPSLCLYSLWPSWIPQRLLTFSTHKALSCWVCSGRRSTPNSAAPDLFSLCRVPLPTLLCPRPGKGGLSRKGCVRKSQPHRQSRLLKGHQVKMRVLFQIWVSFSESFEIISNLQENYKDGWWCFVYL